MQVRQDYQRLCAFIEKWDEILGYLVLSSFVSNIYQLLLLIQLLLRWKQIEACSDALIQVLLVFQAQIIMRQHQQYLHVQIVCYDFWLFVTKREMYMLKG